jgi:fibronectin-binding autotransporter adhesin
MGLVSVANAGIDSWRDLTNYNTGIGAGDTFGEAWYTWGQTGEFTPSLTMFGDPLLRTLAYTAAGVATWNGGTASWTNQGTTWTANGSAFTWNNKGIGAQFNSPAPAGPISVAGRVYTDGLTTNGDGYTFNGSSSDLIEMLAGGITANGNTTINCPILIADHQSWNVASGKTLTVGAVHTLSNDLTFSGAGNTIVAGQIDAGDVLNIVGAGRLGSLTQAGTGVVTLCNTQKFTGDVTAQSGAGPLNISPTGGVSVAYDGAYFGGGTINVTCSGTFTLGGGASNFSGTLNMLEAGTLNFTPAAGIKGTFSGPINTSGPVVQNGPGTTVLSYSNTYAGTTTISNGVLEAKSGVGLPTDSHLCLDGGVLQSNGASAVSFLRPLGTSGNTFEMTANGGGFSAGAAAMNVYIGGNSGTVTWGDAVGVNLVGPLKLSSTTAANVVTFKNAVALNGETRTIHVDDNPNSTADYAVMEGVISGSAGITKTGSGLLSLTATNKYTGTTTINDGVLQANLGTGIPGFFVLNGGVLQTAYTTFTRSLGTSGNTFQWQAGGGGFASTGGGLSVNIGNHATPDTLVWGATPGVNIMGPLKLGSSSTANFVATFKNSLDLGGGAQTIQVDCAVAYFPGVISGAGSLTKTGPGKMTLSGTGNTYTGSTTILSGDVDLNTSSGHAIPGDLVLGGSTSFYVNLVGNNQIAPTAKLSWTSTDGYQYIQLMGHSQTVAGLSDTTLRGVVENSQNVSYNPVTLTFNNSTGCYFNGYLRNNPSGSGSELSVVKTGSGTQTISGSGIQYTGSTTVTEGTLILENINCATILARNIVNNATLGIGCTDGNFSPKFTGVISGSGGLIKTGAGVATLCGSSSNTYTGPTTVLDGTFILAKTSGYAIPGDFTIANGNTYLIVRNANQFPATAKVSFTGTNNPHFEIYGNTVTVGGLCGTVGGIVENTEGESGPGNGTLIINNTEDCSYQSSIRNTAYGSGTLAIVKTGPARQTIMGICAYTGNTTISDGVLQANSGVSLPTASFLSLNGGILQSNGSSTINFTRGLATSGSGKFEMTANGGGFSAGAAAMNVYIGGGSGTVTWGDAVGTNLVGTLKLSSTSAAAVTTFTNSIALNGAVRTVQVDNNPGTSADYAVLSGTLSGTDGGLMKTGDGLLALSKNNTYTGLTTVSNGTLQIGINSSSGSVAGNIFVDAAGVLSVNRTGSVSFDSKLTGTGTLSKNGSGTLTMTGSNSFSGNVTVNSGKLDYSGNSTLPRGNYVVTGGTLSIGSIPTSTISGFQITGGVVNGTGTLSSTSAYDVQGGTVSAILGGDSIGLNKTGSGTAVLDAANTYGGSTMISAGTLKIANKIGSATGSSAVTVNSGATLAGSGSIGGPVSIAGVLAPGSGPGILTVNNQVAFQPGSTFNAEVFGLLAGSGYDQLTTTGPVSLAGSLAMTFGSFTPTGHDVLCLINSTGSGDTTGAFQYADDARIGTFDGFDWFITYDANYGTTPSLNGGNDVAIYSTAVPEPATLVLLATGLLSAFCLAGRKRRSSWISGVRDL